jgi:hypothetical protein
MAAAERACPAHRADPRSGPLTDRKDPIVDATTGNYPPSGMRVSDADRDRAIADLSGHFQTGRLSYQEFDERSGQALRARTGSELTGLLADLPAGSAAASITVSWFWWSASSWASWRWCSGRAG